MSRGRAAATAVLAVPLALALFATPPAAAQGSAPDGDVESAAPSAAEPAPALRFSEIGAAAGARHLHSTRSFGDREKAQVLEMFTDGGAAVAVGDFDGDGWDDLLLTDSAEGGEQHLLHNRTAEAGEIRFTDVARAAGVVGGNTAGAIVADAVFFDHDNDGRQDLLVARFGTPLLYRNLGPAPPGDAATPARFEEISAAAGLTTFANTLTTITFDADGDGWLDLLFANYFQARNLLDLDTPHVLPNNLDDADNGGGLALWRNVAAEGGGRRFVDVTAAAGLAHHTGWSMDLGHGDLDNDGDQDVYVASDYGTDRLFINRGDGSFDDVTEEVLGFDTKKGMNVDMGDYDRNGFLDVFVTNITDEYMRECNMLWHNVGDGSFLDLSRETGTCDSDWGWAGKFADLDNDGWEDIFTVNGLRSAGEENYIPVLLEMIVTPGIDFSSIHSYPDIGDRTWSGYQEQRLFKNLGDGTFVDVAAAAGVDNDLDGRGVAVADFDHDGRLDLVQTNGRQPSLLYRNVSTGTGHRLELRLTGGAGSNRDAVGARVTVRAGGESWIREVDGGNGYAGQSTRTVHFGLGEAARIDAVEIRWPSGRVQTLRGADGAPALAIDALHEIDEPNEEAASPAPPADPVRLAELRNLGKALYENPATQYEAVEVLAEALALAPESSREQVNHALALLRAGREEEGVAALEAAQEDDPSLPHTWFNLGIAYKRAGRYAEAVEQLEKMAELVPDEPITRYNLGVLYKLQGRPDASLAAFEKAAELDPYLAGARFQLATAYRTGGDDAAARRAMEEFRDLKALQSDDAVAEDLEWSYYSELYDPRTPGGAAAEPMASPRFEERRLATGLDAASGLHLVDADDDGRPDLLIAGGDAVLVLFAPGVTDGAAVGGEASGEAEQPRRARIEAAGLRAVAPGDFDDDGLADLALVTADGVALWRNTGGAFAPHAEALPEAAGGDFRGAAWLDYDHDYDVDLVLLGAASTVLRNTGEGDFVAAPDALPLPAGTAVDAVQLDLVPDTPGLDLAVAYADRAGAVLRDLLGGRYAAEELAALPAGARELRTADLDDDGWTDLVARGPGQPVLLRNEGKAGFTALDPPHGLPAAAAVALLDVENRGAGELVSMGPAKRPPVLARNFGEGLFGPAAPVVVDPWRAPTSAAGDAAADGGETAPTPVEGATAGLVATDLDADGLADLAVVSAQGQLRLLLNRTETRHHWLTVDLTGVKNLKAAPGAEVEVKAATGYQKKLWRGVPLSFGLGPRDEVETVRITWPNGLIQNEPRQEADRVVAFEEAQRLSGSCPMVYTWNGEEMEFISDILGVAPLGAAAGDGVYFQVDHDEYLGIRGEQLAPRDGVYDVRLTEELREVGFVDLARLVVVDHPANVEILHNDKFKGPPYPEFALFGVGETIRPVAAGDHHGHDVLAAVLAADRTYPDDFARDYAGVAERHHLDLDFGPGALSADPEGTAVLVLHGWVDWADGSTFKATAQPGGTAEMVMPHLQMKDEAGRWVTVVEDLGLPAGKPKSIVVDLAGTWPSAARELRIVTSLAVYWDEIYLAPGARDPEVRLTELEPRSADLRFRGFARVVVHPERLQPESFVYADVSPTAMWNPTPGLYTRYGDVEELLREIDDRFVVFGSGDELALEFDATAVPALPAGWRRDYLLFVDGWAKDGDANTAHSQTVGPLPYHGMPEYPYGDAGAFPDDEKHRRYVEEWLTRPALRLIRPLHAGGTARGAAGDRAAGGRTADPGPPSLPFTDVTEEAGIAFVHDNAASGEKLLPETMGGGVAFVDYDEDGDPDLLLLHSSRAAEAPVVLYANDGEGRFTDVTEASGLAAVVGKGFLGMGVAVADVDGDGWSDLYLTAVGPNRFLRNREGRFEDATAATGLAGPDDAWGTGAAFFDADGDGDLDLAVASYVTWSPEIDRRRDFRLDGVGRAFGLPQDYTGAHTLLFENRGDGTFAEIGAAAGLHVTDPATGAPLAKGMAVAVEDVDRDGRPDLFVANDTSRNFFFHNRGRGEDGRVRFEEAGEVFGLAYSPDGRNTGAMGVDFGDLGADGRLTLAVGNFAQEVSSLYRAGEDPGFFVDEALAAGLAAATRPALTFAVLLADFDLDGRLDLLQVNGHVEPDVAEADPAQAYRQPPQLFWNAGPDPRTGQPRLIQLPPDRLGDLPHPLAGRGAATADVDGDGDLDLVLTQVGGPAVLLRNDQQTGNHWLRVEVQGEPPNTGAVGARVELEVGDLRHTRTVQPARGYLSSSEPILTFGLGTHEEVGEGRVHWPKGESSVLAPAGADRQVTGRQ